MTHSEFPFGIEPYLSRFVSLLAPGGDRGDCWLWTRAVNSSGYGYFSVHARLVGAHRLAFEWANGPIHSWLDTDHLCRVKRCCNPAHMAVVTHAQNTQRTNTQNYSAVRRAMNALGITTAQLAAAVGRSRKWASEVAGGQAIAAEDVPLVAELLGLTPIDITAITRPGPKQFCKHGHDLSDAYRHGNKRRCRVCVRARNDSWRARNPDKYAAYQHVYQKAYRDRRRKEATR